MEEDPPQDDSREEPSDQEMPDDDNWEAPPKEPKTAKKKDLKSKKGEKQSNSKEKPAPKGKNVSPPKDDENKIINILNDDEPDESAKIRENPSTPAKWMDVVTSLLRTKLIDKFTGEGATAGLSWLKSTWESLKLSGPSLSDMDKLQCVYHCLGQ
eukprot:TRINITY_DN3066_c0_g1_i4.p4 TRINITY_DN3066_c0_g1~~TRINITY_DN3066_c0_g1_i4.p4  ORF type:complete len:155 (+),score=39.97 TRINITY_DN3066_c0_g1_i4:92-556(+)